MKSLKMFPKESLDYTYLREVKLDLENLKEEVQAAIDEDPDILGEAPSLLMNAIENILDEINVIKAAKDLDERKRSKILALIIWLGTILEPIAEQEDDDDEDDDDDDDDDFYSYVETN
jgi:hypothetical protein